MNAREEILEKVNKLVDVYKQGLLGGEKMLEELLRKYLVEYKVALQPNKQPLIWKKICETIENKLDGDIRNLFIANDYSVKKIKEYIHNNKKDFPYLGGNKICNYWLYVIANRWDELLEGTDLKPIDVHTPMWLWSRGKFAINIF